MTIFSLNSLNINNISSYKTIKCLLTSNLNIKSKMSLYDMINTDIFPGKIPFYQEAFNKSLSINVIKDITNNYIDIYMGTYLLLNTKKNCNNLIDHRVLKILLMMNHIYKLIHSCELLKTIYTKNKNNNINIKHINIMMLQLQIYNRRLHNILNSPDKLFNSESTFLLSHIDVLVYEITDNLKRNYTIQNKSI